MAEAFLNHLGVLTGREEECGVGVSQVLEADDRQPGL